MTDAGDGSAPRRLGRPLAVVAAGLVPWVVVPVPGGPYLVSSFGLVTLSPVQVESIVRYVFVDTHALPPRLLAWPTATLLYTLGLGSAGLAPVGREDRRVTAGLFALAGLDVLYFAASFPPPGSRLGAVPLGTAALWVGAWASRPTAWGRI